MRIGNCSRLSFRPNGNNWLGRQALCKGLRQDKGEENYLRVLMLHFGCGLSMRETVARAKQASLAEISSVALFKRLRKSREWLYQLCRALFEERGLTPVMATEHDLRLVDA